MSLCESLLLRTFLFGDSDGRQVLVLLRVEFRQLFLQFRELGFLLVELRCRLGNVGAGAVSLTLKSLLDLNLLLLCELRLAFRQSVLVTRLDFRDNLLFLFQFEPQCLIACLDRGKDDVGAILDLIQAGVVLRKSP